MTERTRAEWIKIFAYRSPAAFLAIAVVVSVAGSAVSTFYRLQQPEVDVPRLLGGSTTVLTSLGLPLFGIATSALLWCDHLGTDGFAGALVPAPGRRSLLIAKLLAALALSALATVTIWTLIVGMLAVATAHLPDSGPVLSWAFLPLLGRLAAAFVLTTVLAWAVTITFRFRVAAIVLFTAVWPLLVERIIGAFLGASWGVFFTPFRALAYYVSGRSYGVTYPFAWGWAWLPFLITTLVLVLSACLHEHPWTRTRKEPQ